MNGRVIQEIEFHGFLLQAIFLLSQNHQRSPYLAYSFRRFVTD
jgi:hypothetical protein